MNIGIDIGSTKTVVYCTLDNGKIVEDEFGKKEISTVLELSSPKRTFGNNVIGDSTDNIRLRKRFFVNNLTSPECQDDLFMFLCYLERTIQRFSDYKSACLAIPEDFTEEHKGILRSIVLASGIKATAFLTHLTSIAACAALRDLKIAENFMIIDCGYSRTSVGLFSFLENCLTPKKRWTIPRGAKDFDEAVISILTKNYNLPDSKVIRERIYKVIDTVKRGLNTLEKVNLKIFSESYDIINMEITRTEYLEKLQPVLKELKDFFAEVKKEANFNGYIEAVGNNSNNVYIQEILSCLNYKTTLNTSESAALGSCLALAVNTRAMQFKVEEILGSNVYVRLEGEKTKPSLLFDGNTPISSKPTKVKYSRKGGFSVEVLTGTPESLKRIGLIKIEKQETAEAEKVVLSMQISSFLTIEVLSVEVADSSSPVSFFYEKFGLSEERIKQIKDSENSFSEIEQQKNKIEEMRNYLENLLDSFSGSIQKSLPGLLKSEEIAKIDSIIDGFFEAQPTTSTVEEEKKVKEEILKSLSFVNEKLKAVENELIKEARSVLEEFDEETKKFLTFDTAASKKLQTSVYNLRGLLSSLNIGIETIMTYDSKFFTETFKNIKDNVKKETELAKAEEMRKREEREKARLEKESLKKKKAAGEQDQPTGEEETKSNQTDEVDIKSKVDENGESTA